MPLRCASFTSAGASSWVVPDQVTGIWVNAIAGGGGGAGGNSLPSHGASGGGSGGWCLKVLMTVVPGETLAITVGAGGFGGPAWTGAGSGPLPGTAGGPGGDTSVVGSVDSLRVSGGLGATRIIDGPETSLGGKGGNGFLGAPHAGTFTAGLTGTFFGLKHGYGGGSSGGDEGAPGGRSSLNSWGSTTLGISNNGGGGGASIWGPGADMQTNAIPAVAGNPAPAGSYGAGGGGPSGNGILGTQGKNGGAGMRGRVDIFWIGA